MGQEPEGSVQFSLGCGVWPQIYKEQKVLILNLFFQVIMKNIFQDIKIRYIDIFFLKFDGLVYI